MEKDKTYYKNTVTGKETTDKSIAKMWVSSGIDVDVIRWSETLEEYLCWLTMEGMR